MTSIVWSLERLFEHPVKIEMREREQIASRRGEPGQTADPPTFQCRVCGFEAPDPSYCPTCLADTMEPADARADRG
jgi:rubrerythrin